MKQYVLHVNGMHCASCVVLTEEALSGAPGVQQVSVSLKNRTVVVTGDDLPASAAETATLLSPHMPAGYTLAAEPTAKAIPWREFAYALPIAALLAAGFVLLQKTGLVSFGGTSGINLGTSLLIGLIASVSTCLAVVGGLVLSVSATYAKTGASRKPQLYFHIGRLVGFFLLGGVLGVLGSSLRFGATGNLILGVAVALIMLVLGVNLLDIFRGAGLLQLRLPKHLSAFVHRLRESTHAAMPLILGAATFFLPCGFTQSMQAYALTTGSFFTGGMTMFIFALGTLPMLALLSLSAFSINNKPWRGVFFKTAGILVILIAIINLLGTLAVAGIIDPVL